MNAPYIIAEAGNNHNGNVETGRKLIDVAVEAGASSVKFQIIYPEELYLTSFYQNGKYVENEVIAARKNLMLSEADYQNLFEYADEKGISVSASVFGTNGLKLLMQFNPSYIKIASCDLNNLRFLREVASYNRKIILSTGMSTLEEIEISVNDLIKSGFDDLVLLHCVSVYPSKLEQTNVSFVSTLKDRFGLPVGFSDHTPSNAASLLAMALGATFFEKHYTLDKSQEGFDHAYALEPEELKSYISALKGGYTALQPAAGKLTEDETNVKARARRSLYAIRDLSAGETISNEDVLVVRPEGIMNANQIDSLIGKTLTKDIKKHQPFSSDHF